MKTISWTLCATRWTRRHIVRFERHTECGRYAHQGMRTDFMLDISEDKPVTCALCLKWLQAHERRTGAK